MVALRRIGETATVPIICSRRGEEEDRVRGLETGADDYVTKPFSPLSWSHGWRRFCGGHARPLPATACLWRSGNGPRRPKVKRDGETIPLGPTEFRLLATFSTAQAGVLARTVARFGLGQDSEIELRTSTFTSGACARRSIPVAGPISSVRPSAGYALDTEDASDQSARHWKPAAAEPLIARYGDYPAMSPPARAHFADYETYDVTGVNCRKVAMPMPG